MSTMALEQQGGPTVAADDLLRPVKERIRAGREHKKQFEPTWHHNLAVAAGKHWLVWDRWQRTLVVPEMMRDKELYAADVVTEYRTAALGELGSDDDRPELLLRRDDTPSEAYQAELNRAVAFGWDHEWDGDTVTAETDQVTIDLGTAAVRCRFDPTVGPIKAQSVPHLDGRPVLDPEQQRALFENGPNPAVTMKPIRQGKISWDVLTPFNLIVPPGVPHERYFTWECVVRPVPLDAVKAEYGDLAADLKEDGDIGSVYGWTTDQGPDIRSDPGAPGGGPRGRLRDHVWLFTYFEKPTSRYPQGRTITLASNRMVPLRFEDSLPYQDPDGSWCSGIAYFHWWRVTGRFWSRALVEVLKDGQRTINKRRTQINEIIDRNMPLWFVQRDSAALNRKGTPMEFVELDPSERQPLAHQGAGPGPWMQPDVEATREDLEHASGIKSVRLGENPQNVTTYSQLALITENDQAKRQQIFYERKRSIARLVVFTVYDIKTYWGQRHVDLDSDNDEIDGAVFDATKIPPFYIVRVPRGTVRPKSQAAELQKIEDIARYSLESAQPLPVSWFKESLDAGQALALPESPTDDQAEKAHLENHLMLQGSYIAPDYFDPPATHIPIHRSQQIQARIAGDQQTFQLIEQHIQETLQQAAANAQQIGQPPMAAGPQPAAGPGPQQQPYPPVGAALNRPL